MGKGSFRHYNFSKNIRMKPGMGSEKSSRVLRANSNFLSVSLRCFFLFFKFSLHLFTASFPFCRSFLKSCPTCGGGPWTDGASTRLVETAFSNISLNRSGTSLRAETRARGILALRNWNVLRKSTFCGTARLVNFFEPSSSFSIFAKCITDSGVKGFEGFQIDPLAVNYNCSANWNLPSYFLFYLQVQSARSSYVAHHFHVQQSKFGAWTWRIHQIEFRPVRRPPSYCALEDQQRTPTL